MTTRVAVYKGAELKTLSLAQIARQAKGAYAIKRAPRISQVRSHPVELERLSLEVQQRFSRDYSGTIAELKNLLISSMDRAIAVEVGVALFRERGLSEKEIFEWLFPVKNVPGVPEAQYLVDLFGAVELPGMDEFVSLLRQVTADKGVDEFRRAELLAKIVAATNFNRLISKPSG